MGSHMVPWSLSLINYWKVPKSSGFFPHSYSNGIEWWAQMCWRRKAQGWLEADSKHASDRLNGFKRPYHAIKPKIGKKLARTFLYTRESLGIKYWHYHQSSESRKISAIRGFLSTSFQSHLEEIPDDECPERKERTPRSALSALHNQVITDTPEHLCDCESPFMVLWSSCKGSEMLKILGQVKVAVYCTSLPTATCQTPSLISEMSPLLLSVPRHYEWEQGLGWVWEIIILEKACLVSIETKNEWKVKRICRIIYLVPPPLCKILDI